MFETIPLQFDVPSNCATYPKIVDSCITSPNRGRGVSAEQWNLPIYPLNKGGVGALR
jgi:hypothetical protein